MIENILTELRKPFHPSAVTWKPGSVNKEGTKGLALAYADIRAYMNRLDEVCGMTWSVTYTPWGERIVCHLTIDGVTRSSTGESDTQSERSEIGGTSAEAQAFKRACAMFGVGRYLYTLPTVWVEMEDKKFTDRAKARLEGVIVAHYKRAMGTQPAATTESSDQVATEESDKSLLTLFDGAGESLYGQQWEQVRRHNAERISEGAVSDPAMLSSEQVRKLLKGMQSMQRKQSAAA